MSEDLQHGEGVVNGAKPWVLMQGAAEFCPGVPCGIITASASCRDASTGSLLDSAEFNVEAK
jgi:hypothetical protein